jgi:hypothetical protein
VIENKARTVAQGRGRPGFFRFSSGGFLRSPRDDAARFARVNQVMNELRTPSDAVVCEYLEKFHGDWIIQGTDDALNYSLGGFGRMIASRKSY